MARGTTYHKFTRVVAATSAPVEATRQSCVSFKIAPDTSHEIEMASGSEDRDDDRAGTVLPLIITPP